MSIFPSRAILTVLSVCCLVSASGVGAGDTDPPPPDIGWLTRLHDCLGESRSFSAVFEQDVIHSSGKAGASARGELLATREGLLRMIFSEPAGQMLYVDARNATMIRPDSDAVFTTPLDREPLAQALLLILRAEPEALLTQFSVRQVTPGDADAGGRVVVSLVPIASTGAISELLIVLEPVCPSLVRIIILDRARTAVRLTLSDVHLNVKIPRGAFTVPAKQRRRLVHP